MKKLLLLFLLIATPAQAQWVITFTEGTAGEAEIPFMAFDVTDGETPETGITFSTTTECQVSENGGAFADCSVSSSTVTEVGSGLYVFNPGATVLDTRGQYVVKLIDAAADNIYLSYQVRPAFEAKDFTFRGVTTSESTTTIGLAANDVDADDQYTEGAELRLYDTDGLFYGSACIVDSANSGDTVTLAVDLSSLHTTGDSYEIVPSALCRVFTQITTVPAPATAFDGASLLRIVYQFMVNEFDSTASEQRWYRNDGTTVWTTRDIADDATTYTRTAQETDD